MQKAIPNSSSFSLEGKAIITAYSACFALSFFFLVCSAAGSKIKNTISTTAGSVPSYQTIMGVYHALPLTWIY